MREILRAVALNFSFFLAVAAQAAEQVRIALRVEPAQVIRAVTLRSNGESHSFDVRNGAVMVPEDLPLPWAIGLRRFEQTQYTQRDLEHRAPLVLRELGTVRVDLRPMPAASEVVRGFFVRNGEASPVEVTLTRDDDRLTAMLPAGLYAGAFLSGTRATRIRAGIVLASGRTTDVKDVLFEPTASASMRVLDAATRKPIVGATVTWSPPDALNADVARAIYSRVWTANTDRSGIATFRAIGPPPLPAQWAVSAEGYASTLTPRALLSESRAWVVGDTLLRRDSVLIVEAVLPRNAPEFRNAMLVIAAPESDTSRRYEPLARQPLVDGENRIRIADFGPRRIAIEDRAGRKLFFQDVELSPNDLHLTIAPMRTEISGVVRRAGTPLQGAFINIADARDARALVARVTSDEDGRYRVATYQSGEVLVYTNGRHGSVVKRLRLDGDPEMRIDFDQPVATATLRVVDAITNAPIRAMVRGELADNSGGRRGVFAETNEDGVARIDNAPEGTAKVFVRADGYVDRELNVQVGVDVGEVRVMLSKGAALRGRVVERNGAPIANAKILGGYPSLVASQGRFEANTDANGRFEIGGASAGATFYVVARGHAVAITTLRENVDNVIALPPPNAGAVTLVAGNAPPKKLQLVLPAPQGGGIIPFGVFDELGTLNGLTPFQLLSSGVDGALVLPEFLAPGAYAFYFVRSTGRRDGEQFDKVFDLAVPARAGTLVRVAE